MDKAIKHLALKVADSFHAVVRTIGDNWTRLHPLMHRMFWLRTLKMMNEFMSSEIYHPAMQSDDM